MAAMDSQEQQHPMISKVGTNKAVLDLKDAIPALGKVIWGMTDHSAEPHKFCRFYVSTGDCLVLARTILAGRLKKFGPLYGGGGAELQCRIFEIEYDENDKSSGYYVKIANGPGVTTGNGAIRPDAKRKDEMVKVNMFVATSSMQAIMAELETRIKAHIHFQVARMYEAQESYPYEP